jgi:hypothetical protein
LCSSTCLFLLRGLYPLCYLVSMGCFMSRSCCANFDLLLLYLKSLRCSWYLTLKGLPVCPVYFMLHSGHVSNISFVKTCCYSGVCCLSCAQKKISVSFQKICNPSCTCDFHSTPTSWDGVMEFFIDINPSDRTMALGLAQPLTEMSTRCISWG